MTIHTHGLNVQLQFPLVMGILNVTPDSFYGASRVQAEDQLLTGASAMLQQGAAILDVGGMSSRPGAEIITVEEELSRVLPMVRRLHAAFPQAIISVDTIRARVAAQCLQAGAHIINDISAGRYDAAMLQVVAQYNAPFIIMHMLGLPATMQQNPQYRNVAAEVKTFFEERIAACLQAGIKQLVLDPGFGFGKTVEHNYKLLRQLPVFTALGYPLLAGVSRKGMIGQVLQVTPAQALNGTTAVHMLALQNGAAILRVHDVAEAMECMKIYAAYKGLA